MKALSRFLTVVVFATSITIGSPIAASAASDCDALEANLHIAIRQATVLSTINRAALEFRTCMATQADSSNAQDVIGWSPTGPFYAIFTTQNTYRFGRTVALRAAADYRYSLDGLSPNLSRTLDCNIYLSFTSGALSLGDTSLAALGQMAYQQCFASLQVLPRGTVRVFGNPSVGNQLSASITGSFNNVGIGYQWFSDGTPISGATASAYNLQAIDAGKSLSVRVTFRHSDLVSNTRTSLAVRVAADPSSIATPTASPTPTATPTASPTPTATPTASPTPTATPTASPTPTATPTPQPLPTLNPVTNARVSGELLVGSTLTLDPGAWEQGTSIGIQWQRGGLDIPGATNALYRSVSLDIGRQIGVKVTAVKNGFQPRVTILTAGNVRNLPSLDTTPVPVIQGPWRVGSILTAVPGVWDSGVSISFQWNSGGNPIWGETRSSYRIRSSDIGREISLSVTGTKEGFLSSTQSSVRVPSTWSRFPSIDASSAQVGQVLTAYPGDWPMSNIQNRNPRFSYQWLRDGIPISGGFSNTYRLTESDGGSNISLRVGVQEPVAFSSYGVSTWRVTSRTSSSLFIQKLPEMSSTPVPTILGDAVFGNGTTIEANPGVWDSGASLSFQWVRNGLDLVGQRTSRYVPTAADVGQQIRVRVTGTKSGFTSATKESVAVSPTSLPVLQTPGSVGISGQLEVGKTLTAIPGAWGNDVSLTYQWFINGSQISGATSSTYTPGAQDSGRNLRFVVTGRKAGFIQSSIRSPDYLVALQQFVSTPIPTISSPSGLSVGRAITAIHGEWDRDTLLWYSWLRNGKPIPGATSRSYTVTEADAGQGLSVRVTGTKLGFESKTVESSSIVSLPSLQEFSSSASIGISCAPAASCYARTSRVPKATVNGWGTGVTFEYKWFRRNLGEFSNTLVSTRSQGTLTGIRQLGILILEVTASKPGFRTKTVSTYIYPNG